MQRTISIKSWPDLVAEMQQKREGNWREEDYKGVEYEISVWPDEAEAWVSFPDLPKDYIGIFDDENSARKNARACIDQFWRERRAIARVNEIETRGRWLK